MKRLQMFYSKCVRYLTQEPYSTLTCRPTSNKQIRNTYNVPTIESKLKILRYRMFANWKHNLSFAYLNSKQYVHSQLNQLSANIKEIQDEILKFQENNGNTAQFDKNRPLYHNTHYRKSGHITRRNIIKTTINRNTNREIQYLKPGDIANLCKLIPNTLTKDEDDIKQQNAVLCQSCQETFPSEFKFTRHLTTNPDCDIIHKLDKCAPKQCPNQNCKIWCSNEHELQKRRNYHCHLANEEKRIL